MELDGLTLATFEPLLGEAFELPADTQTLELTLTEATDVSDPAAPASSARAPFSLVFRGPAEPLLPQAIYSLEHEALGPLAIFIVPIGRDADGARYEAVFA